MTFKSWIMVLCLAALIFADRPQPKITLSPAGFSLSPLRADRVTVRFSAPENSDFWCPHLSIDWGGIVSSHEEDCDPADEGQAYFYTFRGSPNAVYTSDTELVVRAKQGRHEWQDRVTVRVQ